MGHCHSVMREYETIQVLSMRQYRFSSFLEGAEGGIEGGGKFQDHPPPYETLQGAVGSKAAHLDELCPLLCSEVFLVATCSLYC